MVPTVVLLLSGWLCFSPASAQGLNSETIYSRETRFRIPFEADPARRIQRIELYVSIDQGQTWQSAGTATPDQKGFDFRADRQGLFWFDVRTVDFQGQVNPPNLQSLRPQLKVFVDTQAPVVSLRQGAAREGGVAVEWQIREENLDLSSFNLEYRAAGSAQWIPLQVTGGTNGQYAWNPGAAGAIEVRLRVRDLAKNEGEDKLTIVPGGQAGQSGQFPSENRQVQNSSESSAGTQYATQPAVRYVNSKQIRLDYSIEEKGPSGIDAIEVWMTRDGQTWAKLDEFRAPQPQAASNEIPIAFPVQEEGIYGFTLVPRSGAGLKEPEPRRGDRPQIWVDVDTTKPVIAWLHAEVGRGAETGKLFVTWKALDPLSKGSDKEKDLGREAVTIKYAENRNGLWRVMTEKQLNTGRYEWKMPPEDQRPVKFFVRLEVTDKAGNIETLDTPQPINVDLKVPRGRILDAKPDARPAGSGL
jgi:hypothetical protein